jgi:hypothetical protein
MNFTNERVWDHSRGLNEDVSDKILELLLASIATVVNIAGMTRQYVNAAVPDGADSNTRRATVLQEQGCWLCRLDKSQSKIHMNRLGRIHATWHILCFHAAASLFIVHGEK